MLTESQHDHLETLLNGLGTINSKLDPKSRTFVEQTNERFAEYEDNIRISQKQLDWLENLYKRFVGPLD